VTDSDARPAGIHNVLYLLSLLKYIASALAGSGRSMRNLAIRRKCSAAKVGAIHTPAVSSRQNPSA